MPWETSSIRIAGLSRTEANDIEDLLDRHPEVDDVRLEEQALPSYRLGEPITFLLLAAAIPSAIAVVGAFLMKRRTRQDIRYQVVVESPDGTKRTETLELSRRDSQQPDPEVIEALASITGVPFEQVVKALGPPA